MKTTSKAPKIRCPMSGRSSGRIGGTGDSLGECEHCGKLVFVSERSLRVAKHWLPAGMARDLITPKENA